MLWILPALCSGFVIGLLRPPRARELQALSVCVTTLVLGLVFSMGVSLGADGGLVRELPTLGLSGLLFAAATVVGSVVPVALIERLGVVTVPAAPVDPSGGSDSVQAGSVVAVPLVILGVLATGLGTGNSLLLADSQGGQVGVVTSVIIGALLFVIGVQLGGDRRAMRAMRDNGARFLLVPLAIVAGTAAGAVASGLCLGIESGASLAVGFGFGWYSLSGVMIAKAMGAQMGALALIANVARELITILTLPFVVRFAGRLAAVAPGGATSMDVTLPFISRYAGRETGLMAFTSGVVLSALVPVLVPIACRI